MKVVVAVVFSVACLLACQNDYPLDPTPCDDYCYEVERVFCWDEDPADCVASCEEFGRPKDPECRARWEEMLACLQGLPDGAGCTAVFPMPCEAEHTAVYDCQWPREPAE